MLSEGQTKPQITLTLTGIKISLQVIDRIERAKKIIESDKCFGNIYKTHYYKMDKRFACYDERLHIQIIIQYLSTNIFLHDSRAFKLIILIITHHTLLMKPNNQLKVQ